MGLLQPRLVGGQADPNGTWAYGRLELFDGNLFSSIDEESMNPLIGRRGVQTACRTLGFSTGAQLVSARFSALPATDRSTDTLGEITCDDYAETLADCTSAPDNYGYYFEPETGAQNAVAVLCYKASGVLTFAQS